MNAHAPNEPMPTKHAILFFFLLVKNVTIVNIRFATH